MSPDGETLTNICNINIIYVSELLRGLKGSPTLLSILSFIEEIYSLWVPLAR